MNLIQIVVSYPKTTVDVAVQAELMQGSSFQIPGYDPIPGLLPVFRWKFDEGSNQTYIYDIFWYIHGFKITSYNNIPMKDINITLLKHTDWIDSYKMNMEVQCAIRMRYLAYSVPGPLQYSSNFKAGIFPETYDYTVIEGESITISFKSTVPVGCIASNKNLMAHCDQSFYVFQSNKNSNAESCSNNIAIKDIIIKAQFCGIKFGATDWQEEKKLEVYGCSDGLYNSGDRSTYIRFSTSAVSAFNEMWQNVHIPDIQVKVLDKDASMTNRLCQSVNDPHITTFDGKYYHFMDIGEFVMYRNDKGPYWVTLPIGTEIKISISRWSGFIGTVTVKPSIYDINEAKGQCGVLSVTKDPSDDYNHRYNGPVSSDQEFAKSWRITPAMTNEQLFVDETNFIKDDVILNLPNNPASINISTTFCTCEDQAGSTESIIDFNTVQCNLTESTEFYSSSQQSGNQINSYSTSCTISKRKRRSLDHSSVVPRNTADADGSDDVTESQPLVFDEDINSTDVISQTFRNEWTANKAYQTCQEALATAIPADVYSDFVEVDVDNFIQSCVSDIKVVDSSKLYSSNWEINKAQYRNIFMVTVDLGVSRKTRSASEPTMAEGHEITLSNDGTNFGEEVTILIYDEACFSCNSSMTCISLEVCESSEESQENNEDIKQIKVKSWCILGCQHESGRNVDNGMLSNRTKPLRENPISDLDVYFEDDREATINNVENQLPPQNHFQNN
ncbi:unnamed protein product [Mytilus coruscus]|uniref:Vwde helical domain-containing protein n=1 Tax=Mytilus coruscus TaxID=42192 RepID=A0A6J8DV15_MYTCO|nr:unnamed protein product [Mytilus coruscus]